MTCNDPPNNVLHDAVKVEWSGSSDPSGVRCISVAIGDVRISDTGTWLTTGAALNALTSGLRALNDAPIPRRRIYVNVYSDGYGASYETPGEARYASVRGSCDRQLVAAAVPFIEEKP